MYYTLVKVILNKFDLHTYFSWWITVFPHINPSSPKGGVVPTPLTVIALVLKIAQPRGKIAPGTFKFILSLHFNEKISNLPPTPGVG